MAKLTLIGITMILTSAVAPILAALAIAAHFDATILISAAEFVIHWLISRLE